MSSSVESLLHSYAQSLQKLVNGGPNKFRGSKQIRKLNKYAPENRPIIMCIDILARLGKWGGGILANIQ